ncbi:MAG: hypothetical protein NVS3B12_04740 [Acidimicrobiales bacterium]
MTKKEWPLDKVLSAIGGSVVLVSLGLGRTQSSKWRLLTAVVGANLVLNGTVGSCPVGIVLHRLGVRTECEMRERVELV